VEEVVEESFMIRPVFFAFDSYALSSAGKEKLDGLAAIMQRFPNLKLEVVGHTDAMGPDAYNDLLAKRRADAVAGYLVEQGVSADRLITVSRGEKEPAARNTTPDGRDAPKGRELNRRVHFNVSMQGGVLLEIKEIEVPDQLKLK
ncbi:MAG: OmpA family protein, partial [Bacteroidales bacterium]|nr:OmpA family protein [Bacteroidales bacterium]